LPSSEYVFLEDSQQILAIAVLGQGLAVFEGSNELAGIEQGFVGASVEPRYSHGP